MKFISTNTILGFGLLIAIAVMIGVNIWVAIGTVLIAYSLIILLPPIDVEFLIVPLLTTFYLLIFKKFMKKNKAFVLSTTLAIITTYVSGIVAGWIGFLIIPSQSYLLANHENLRQILLLIPK